MKSVTFVVITAVVGVFVSEICTSVFCTAEPPRRNRRLRIRELSCWRGSRYLNSWPWCRPLWMER